MHKRVGWQAGQQAVGVHEIIADIPIAARIGNNFRNIDKTPVFFQKHKQLPHFVLPLLEDLSVLMVKHAVGKAAGIGYCKNGIGQNQISAESWPQVVQNQLDGFNRSLGRGSSNFRHSYIINTTSQGNGMIGTGESMLDPKFVIFGALLNLVGSTSYLIATLKGKTRPNRVTWFLWAMAPLIAFSAEIKEGVGLQSLMTFMVGFGPLIVFIGSFVNKKSVWRLSTFDYVCGGLSLLGLILWLITRHGNIAIIFSIAADGLAAMPTVVKSFIEPESESGYIFGLGAVSAAITLLTIDKWTFASYGFPLYILIICLILFSLIQLKLGQKLTASELNEPKAF